jgi:transposase
MWTQENRDRYDRSHLRYASDLTDAEWAEVGPLIPSAKRGGNKRTVHIREVVNGVMYVLSTGCQWRATPKDLPPKSTVHDYLERWTCDGTLERIHHALYVKCREQASREASPTAAIIDSQSVKSAEKGGRRLTRMAMTQERRSRVRSATSSSTTQGLMLQAIVHAADIQDRDGGALLLATLFGMFPFLLKLYADGGYRGPEFQSGLKRVLSQAELQIVKRSDHAKGFVVLPRRWVVERTLAWLNRCRRLTKDWENLNVKARAFLLLASIRLMVRRLCQN